MELSNDFFDTLPDDIVVQIVVYESIQNISKLCQISRRFNNLICNNNNFWRWKFIYDFGSPSINIISWKEAYKTYGRVIGFGSNIWGQLGLPLGACPLDNNRNLLNVKARSVSCGYGYTMIIDLENNVWAFGSNYYGQLGLGDNLNRDIPIRILNMKAKFISCGYYHTMMIDLDNNVWAFGRNECGQLGLPLDTCPLDNHPNRNTPIQIPNIKAKSISCGKYHTIMIDFNNNVWAFGHNRFGQLGLPLDACPLDDNRNRYIPTQIPNMKAKSSSCGYTHTIIIDIDNNVWAFGWNDFGQLGLGDKENRNIPNQILNIRAKSISCGEHHTMIIDMDNNVWAFGNNKSGQLGLNDNENRNTPVQIFNMEVRSISCGGYHTMIIVCPNQQSESNIRLIPFNETVINVSNF